MIFALQKQLQEQQVKQEEERRVAEEKAKAVEEEKKKVSQRDGTGVVASVAASGTAVSSVKVPGKKPKQNESIK